MTERPAFEIHIGRRVMKIYVSGRVEGWTTPENVPAGHRIIVNRIPQLIAEAVAAAVASKAA